MRKGFILLFFCATAINLTGQIPVISSVSKTIVHPQEKLVISGSGFNTNSSLLQVWFGNVMAPISFSSNFSIEVSVPAQAKLSNPEVINLSSNRSGKFNKLIAPYFSGTLVDATTFAAMPSIPSTAELYDICSCDLNGDGKPDLASTKFSNKLELLVLKNQSTIGNISFTEQSFAANNYFTDKITCGDLNGDGKPELVASRSDGGLGGNRNAILIMPNTSSMGTVSFDTPKPLFLSDPLDIARYIVIRDLNMDGKPELIVSNSNDNNTFYIFLNKSAGGILTFDETPISLTIPGLTPTTTFGLDVQDFDEDGKPDIAISEWQSSRFYVYRNTSNAAVSFDDPFVKEIPNANLYKLIAIDLNKDGKIDLAFTDFFSNKITIVINGSSASNFVFNEILSFDTGTTPEGLDAGDIDGDQDIDLAVASRMTNKQINILLNDGAASPSFSRIDISNPKSVRNITMGDLDGDAKPDLAFTSFNSSTFVYAADILRNTACFVPKILNELPITNCTGQTIRIESVPGYGVNFDWKLGASSIQSGVNPYVDISTAGSYTVTATRDGCSKTTDFSLVTNTGSVPADPLINVNTPACSGQDINFSTASVPGATYVWTGPNEFASGLPNPSITQATGINGGTYTLQIVAGFCKSNVVTKTVEIIDLEGLSITSISPTNAICNGSTLDLSVPFYNDYSYQWLNNSVDIPGKNSSLLGVTSSGNYSVRVSYPSIPGCSKTTQAVSVLSLNPPVADFTGNLKACINQDYHFINQTQSDPLGVAIESYSWTFGGAGTSTDKDPVFGFDAAQSYNVTLVAGYIGVDGCKNSISKTLAVVLPQSPQILASANQICPDEPSSLSVTGGTFVAFDWSTGGTDPAIEVIQPGIYSVITTDENGCSGTDEITLASKTLPVVSVSADRTTIAAGEQAKLQASGADTYTWEPAQLLDNPNIPNPGASPVVTTIFIVTGTLTGQCSAKDSITIQVSGDANFPNVFTPNGDGNNDKWVIPSISSFTDCTISVFDRSGVRIIEQRGYANDWDGTYNGKNVPEGVYFYVMGCPDRPPITGHVLIHR